MRLPFQSRLGEYVVDLLRYALQYLVETDPVLGVSAKRILHNGLDLAREVPIELYIL